MAWDLPPSESRRRSRWRAPGAGGYAALAVAAMLSPLVFASSSFACIDETRVASVQIIAREPQRAAGFQWATAIPLWLKVAPPCSPNDDCGFLYVPLATQTPPSDWAGSDLVPLLPSAELDPQITSARILAQFPGDREFHLRVQRGNSPYEVTITPGADPKHRRLRLEERDETDERGLHGDFSLEECL